MLSGALCRAFIRTRLGAVSRCLCTPSFDLSSLRQNDFWKKKLRRAFRVRDANRDGVLTRSDFQRTADCYRQMGISDEEHVEKVRKSMNNLSDAFGLVDDSVILTYEQFEDNWFEAAKERDAKALHEQLFTSMFNMLDIDGSGDISFEEWKAHSKSLGIDAAHARASFDAMDTNHDQKISKEEFVNFHLEYFLSTENQLNSAIHYGPLD